MFGKTVQLEGDIDVAVLLDHDRYMELYEAAQRGTRQQGPAAGDARV